MRLMAGLLLLKQLENLSDERVCEAWGVIPTCNIVLVSHECRLRLGIEGERYFQWKLPCESSELVHFPNRIGQDGVEKIL